MQKLVLKFVLILLTLVPIFLKAQTDADNAILYTADSLFQSKRYTQALIYYDALHEKGLNSEAMLIKMAFIHEGLENIADALYYLNLYYLQSKDPLTLQKMTELADKNKLSGYAETEADLLYGFYTSNFNTIALILMVIMIFVISLGSYLKRREAFNRATFFLLLLLPGLLLLAHVNFGARWKKGIVLSHQAILMQGPSAASGVAGVAKPGTRFDIIGRKDTWLIVRTTSGKAYVKESSVKPVVL